MNEATQHPVALSVPVRRNNILVMAVCMGVIAIYGYQVFADSSHFDIWYLIATGREIVENGIPHENVFSMIPDAKIVVQQWLLCIIYFGIYDLCGFGGIGLFVTFVFFGTIAVLYRIMRVRRRDAFGGEWILLVLLLVMVVIQRQMRMTSTPISILLLSVLVLLLELYRRDGRYRYLVFAVLLVVLHMQVHMSFIVFDLGIIVTYLIPDFVSPIRDRLAKSGRVQSHGSMPHAQQASDGTKLDVQQASQQSEPRIAFMDSGYKRLPLLLLLLAATVATLLNPYGIDGALYLLNSYGAASYGNVIPELRPQAPLLRGVNGICALIAVILSAVAIGKGGLRRIDLPAVLIFGFCTYLGFAYVRNLWMLGLPLVLLGGDMIRGWYIPTIGAAKGGLAYTKWTIALSSIICVAGAGILAMLIALNFTSLDDAAENNQYAPESLIDAIAQDTETSKDEDSERADLRIFNPTVLGGYMEWRGLPVYNDSRIEIWNSGISGLDRDLHNEYVDMTLGKWTSARFDEFVEENDFDYLIAEANSPLHSYLAENPAYQNILGTSYYELYKKL